MGSEGYWKRWAKAAGIRALRTLGQAFVAAVPVTGATLGSVDWLMCLSTAAVAAILSLASSLGGLPEVEEEAIWPDGEDEHE